MSFYPKNQVIAGLMAFSALLVLAPTQASAFGGGQPTPAKYALPNPLRYVVVRPFAGVAAIESPNQVTTTLTDVQDSLNSDLQTVVSAAGTHLSYQTGDVSALDPCGTHLEIWPAVTAFEMNDLTANIQFGFNSTGTINVGAPSATASDTISVGNITLVFGLYQCDNANTGNCTSLLSTQANQVVLGNNFQFNVTWSQLGVSGNILSNADLNNALVKIMQSGVSQISTSTAMAKVPWSVVVASVDKSTGAITFLGGETDDLALNQYFTVYATTSSSSQCGVYQALACIYTTEVDGPSSIGAVYKTLQAGQNNSIVPGDVVEVGSTSCTP